MSRIARLFWVLLGLTAIVYLVIVLWSLPIITRDAGGLTPFDLRPLGYDVDDAVAFLSALGETGLAQYQGAQRILDTIYPALMAATLVLAFARLFRWRTALAFGVVTVLAAVFDYRENIAVADLLALGATGVDEKTVGTAALMTVLKTVFTSIAMLGLLVGLVQAGWRRWVRRA